LDPDVSKALANRPEVFVCPSDSDMAPVAEYVHDLPVRVALGLGIKPGSYALSLGTVDAANTNNLKFYNTGVFLYVKQFRISQITDGVSKTFFTGETINGHLVESSNIWTNGSRWNLLRGTAAPLNSPAGFNPGITLTANSGTNINGAFASRHPGGAVFGFGDGHVSYVADEIDFNTYRWLSTRDGGETVSETP
jgi:prepilin-type processing-associated H-X9-DG protein